MSNLITHAKNELAAAFPDQSEDGPEKWLPENVLQLIEVFAGQGHSGSSAPAVVSMFDLLADFKPLSPITGADSEWFEHEQGMFQNKRNGAVFKQGKNGKPYFLDAIIWRTQTGSTWSGKARLKDGSDITSRQFCRMPFTSKTFYVDVIEREVEKDDWEFTLKDESQLNEVFAYYDRYEPNLKSEV